MREKTTLKSQGEGKGQKRKLAGAALTAALLLNPATSSAQDVKTVEQKQDKKEIVEKNPAVAKVDSTITWDEAVSRQNSEQNPEGRKISQEEIQEYLIRINKEDFMKGIDKEVAVALYKEVMNNEDIQDLIKEMVNRDDVRQAVFEGNKEYIQQQIDEYIRICKREIAILSVAITMIAGIIIGIILEIIVNKK